MTRSKPQKSNPNATQKLRSRQLRFDILEDRRLLAGIDVFVFDDTDGSRSFNLSKDGSLSDRAVYIDINNDGKLNGSEPWTTSDSAGHARFSNLEPGSYSVRMVGTNRSIVQTFPTRSADQGSLSDLAAVSKVLQVEADGTVWGISGNALSRIDVGQNKISQSISFDSAIIVDAALIRSANGDLNGFALTQNRDQSQSLWKVSTEGTGAKQLTGVDVSLTTQLVAVDNRVLAVSGGSSKEVSLVDMETPSLVIFKDIGLAGLAANATLSSCGKSSFLVSESGAGSNRLSLYGLNGNDNQLIGRRSFASNILSANLSSDGAFIAVSTVDDFWILSPDIGLPTKAILPDVVGPMVFDPLRSLLYAGSKTSPSNLTAWSTTNWLEHHSILIANGGAMTDARLQLDSTGSQLYLSQNGTIYTQGVALAAAAIATVSGSQVTQLEIGLRSIGSNRKPVLNGLDSSAVDEDGNLNLDPTRIRSNASDPDGDSLVFLVRENPAYGLLSMNQDATGTYTPFANANGKDYISIQAYDGRDWSATRVMPILINPVNDAPSGIAFSVDSISENPTFQTALATIQTMDPDSDANYQYQVDDSRFSVADGVLRLVQGTINFEDEPILVLAITGVDRQHPNDSISRKITLSIRDVNEVPTGVSTPTNLSQPELTKNLVLGRVFAIDQDRNDQYTWAVSDPRFEVVNGMLKLSEGSMLDFESESSIRLVIRGTDSQGQYSIEKTITVSVTDQDDDPTGITFVGTTRIQENEHGKALGNAIVSDPDKGEAYSFSVNDNRFEVVRGVLRLKPGTGVGYNEPGYLDLMITATSLRSGVRISQSLRVDVLKDPTPHHNDANPYDVDGDGVLTPLDPLVVINHINDNGIGPIEEPGEGEGALPDLDVDGDGEVTPLDILILINKLNQQNEDDEESGTGEGAEGEADQFVVQEPLVQVPLVQVPLVQVPVVQSPVAPPSLFDASLASYLSDLFNEVGPLKLRRR
ncbi:MAG: dockerin type I domain-containing protein [Planctomycetota bacterium]|nr:dockerin type I domain-containing protein [Planctomycetota bacterium]